MPKIRNSPLDSQKRDQRERLRAIVAELKERGVEVPEEVLDIATKKPKQYFFPKDEKGYYIGQSGRVFKANEKQEIFYRSSSRYLGLVAGRGSGKALAISTPIFTERGWVTMGDICVGDVVFDGLGEPTQVTDVSDIFYGHDCYEVSFSDGNTLVADAEHLWVTHEKPYRKSLGRRIGDFSKSKPSVVTTKQILDTLWYRDEKNHAIPSCLPVQCNLNANLPIHPYLLGVWLGNGDKNGNRITNGYEDGYEIAETLGGFGVPVYKTKEDGLVWSVFGGNRPNRNLITGKFTQSDNFLGKLRSLNLLYNKHIPDMYLYSSVENRLNLVRGLMDTDGTCSKNGACCFENTNLEIIRGLYTVLCSLGIIPYHTQKTATLYGKDCGIVYRLAFSTTIPVFYLKRKLERQQCSKDRSTNHYRYVVQIDPVYSVPTRCIRVASETSTFLAGTAFIPTHNSAAGSQKALQKIEQGQSGAVMNPDFANFVISTWPEFREWISPNTVIPQHRYMLDPAWSPVRPFKLVFNNGAIVYCKGLKDPDSARGPNINWLWFDEPGRGDPRGLDWQIANAAVRIGIDPQAWATGTPNGKDHWLYTFFIQQEIPDEAFEAFEEASKLAGNERPLVEVVYTSIEDNKANLDPAYYASMIAAYPEGWLRQQELYGEFVDKGGVLGSRVWFEGKIIPAPLTDVIARIRFYDLAASEKKIVRGKKLNDPDETVGTLMSWDKKNFYIEDQMAGWWAWKELKQRILETAIMDGPHVRIILEEEPGSGGQNQVAEIAEMIREKLPNFMTPIGWRPQGDKVTRANVWFSEASQGLVYLVAGSWNEACLNQISSFPVARHDDRVDSISGARFNLAPIKMWRKMSFLHL